MVPVALSDLAGALALGQRVHVALVGGGGKTMILHALLAARPGPIVGTTTTRMGSDQAGGYPVLVDPTDDEVVAAVGPTMVWRRVEGDKAFGVDPVRCDAWFAAGVDVVAEADGSRGRPFKAPAWYEPVVPRTADLVVHVIGVDALDRVIADQCHRPLRVAALAGCRPGERLTPARAARVIVHERGVRAAIPSAARVAVVVTKVDERTTALAAELDGELRRHRPDWAVVAVAAT